MRPGAPYKSPYESIPSRFHFDWIFDKLHEKSNLHGGRFFRLTFVRLYVKKEKNSIKGSSQTPIQAVLKSTGPVQHVPVSREMARLLL